MPKFGDLVLVPFPFTDMSGNKVRPALVLGAQKGGADITVCFVSSVFKKKVQPLDVLVSDQKKNFKKNGLKVSSVIKVAKIATLDKAVVLGKIGELDGENIRQVKKILRVYFGL